MIFKYLVGGKLEAIPQISPFKIPQFDSYFPGKLGSLTALAAYYPWLNFKLLPLEQHQLQ